MNPDRASNRVKQGVTRGEPFIFTLDSQLIEAFPGETIAAALLAAEIRTLRRTEKTDMPRGLFCGMGVCQECLVEVDGVSNQRACMTKLERHVSVRRQSHRARATAVADARF